MKSVCLVESHQGMDWVVDEFESWEDGIDFMREWDCVYTMSGQEHTFDVDMGMMMVYVKPSREPHVLSLVEF